MGSSAPKMDESLVPELTDPKRVEIMKILARFAST
jgi:hypothetical protein